MPQNFAKNNKFHSVTKKFFQRHKLCCKYPGSVTTIKQMYYTVSLKFLKFFYKPAKNICDHFPSSPLITRLQKEINSDNHLMWWGSPF